MQPHSPPPPRQPSARPAFKPSPGASPQASNANEFTEAVARMFEKRPPVDDTPIILPRVDPPEDGDDQPSGLRARLFGGSALRRALLVVPATVVGYCLVWFFYLQPSQGVAPTAVNTAKVEFQQPVEAVPPAPPPRPVVVEAPPPAASEAAAPPQPAPAAPDLRPLTREEIRELQGKLVAIGFAAGPADGVLGPQTQAALRRYSESRSVKPDPNRELLSRVRTEAAAKP